ncbi:phosphocholine cytidylyltransferase family protein [Peribacillus saganii]|uniref:Phosphocholine cytidylyltransferase family protein n=1 Tax=Peribacillus saganii TaxID=2303992 RepID=A0A372LMX0_9BACI|nr:phosphocholine cytidylyltransferase family protein [Peribacillus saganii]RFU68736.1 phosphocholine cytidylyltransferase family protein [Peribacillus saganii]
MKVVILAAGVGSRLYPLTRDNPKAMIIINGKPLVQYQVDSLLKSGFGFEEIYIVGGYKMNQIEKYFSGTGIHFIYNPLYKSMNNIYSFLLSRTVGDDLLLINSDVLYDSRLIPLILNSNFPSCLLVDREKQLTEEAMKVKMEHNRLCMVNKQMETSEASGEYIGISKLAANDLKLLYQKAAQMIDSGETGVWYEQVYQACAARVDFRAVFTQGYPWIEIDDLQDLEFAKQLVSIMGKS